MPYTTKVIDGTPQPYIMTKTVEISELQQRFGNTVTAPQLQEYAAEVGTTYQTLSKKLANYKTGRGVWTLEVEKLEESFASPAADPVREIKSYVPAKDASFVPFGNFADLKKIIQSKQFYPVFITGLSGNGKTFGVEQACAQLKRELIRVNITIETDEDDLYLKKTGKYVIPADGFNVVATANTKGKGSDDGRFIGTNVLNEAFLERFPITFEQDYPAEKTEVKIVSQALDGQDDDFAEKLVRWAQVIRKTFYDGGVDEVILPGSVFQGG